jgi:cysteine desulfurase/selenocysteine lyase
MTIAASEAVDPKLAGIIADFPILSRPTSRGKRLVYLDSAATSQKPREVIDALVDYYENYNANIHRGVYEIAARATNAYEEARAKVAGFVGADAHELIWVRNTTEAINLVAYTWGARNVGPGDAILSTELEHHSDLIPWQELCRRSGAELRLIPADERGLLILEDLDTLLRGCKLVALGHVSNTLGTVAPLDEIVKRAHAAGARVLVDGAQAVPHFSVNVHALDVDFYAFSGHKMLGPTGIGALYGKREVLQSMPPFDFGGDMIHTVAYDKATYAEPPWRFEAGTGNIADAIALGTAVEYLSRTGMDWVHRHELDLTSYALERLSEFERRGLQIYGPRDVRRATGIVSFNFADIHAHDLASILDTEGICIRAGHHCTMPLMEKMGWPATARASFYLYNTRADIDALAFGLEKAAGVFGIP